MNFDKIITKLELKHKNIKFNSKKLIKKEFFLKESSKELFILIPSWHGHFSYFTLLKNRLFKSGYSCLEYTFSPLILSENILLTKKCFNLIRDNIKVDIKNMKKKYKFSKINIIAASLGCVNALMIANKNSNINKIVLIVPGHCLAEDLWLGIRTQDIRKKLEFNRITLKKLKKSWKNLAPENNLSGLKNKEFKVYLSQSDEVIPYYSGKKLVTKMKKLHVNLKVKENKSLGHYLTILRFLLFPEISKI